MGIFGLFGSRKPALPPERLWALATVAQYTEVMRGSHTALEIAPEKPEWYRKGLAEQWDIQNAQDVGPTLEWLFMEGHRYSFARRAGEAQRYLAWDLCRLIHLARLAYSAGFLQEERAWKWMMAAAEELRRSFGSWAAMGESLLSGRELWAGARDADMDKQYQRLLEPRNARSPWNQHRWEDFLLIQR